MTLTPAVAVQPNPYRTALGWVASSSATLAVISWCFAFFLAHGTSPESYGQAWDGAAGAGWAWVGDVLGGMGALFLVGWLVVAGISRALETSR